MNITKHTILTIALVTGLLVAGSQTNAKEPAGLEVIGVEGGEGGTSGQTAHDTKPERVLILVDWIGYKSIREACDAKVKKFAETAKPGKYNVTCGEAGIGYDYDVTVGCPTCGTGTTITPR